MKQIFSLLLVCTMILGVCACENATDNATKPNTEQNIPLAVHNVDGNVVEVFSCKFSKKVMGIDEENCPAPIPSMVVYFIRPGDTLWEIAKRYRTTPDSILETNNVDPNNLQIGSPIYIFR